MVMGLCLRDVLLMLPTQTHAQNSCFHQQLFEKNTYTLSGIIVTYSICLFFFLSFFLSLSIGLCFF